MEYGVEVWLPFVYQYGVGGLLFAVGIYIFLRSDATDVNKLEDIKWFFMIAGGFLCFLGYHFFFQFIAPYFK